VQGVGFRPFVFRLAQAHALKGWVLNSAGGVEIHLEGTERGLDSFVLDLRAQRPPAAHITAIEVEPTEPKGVKEFGIRESEQCERPTARISPDLPICSACLREFFEPGNKRYGYPYINCTDCGPRYTIVLDLPYDRSRTTMKVWAMCPHCDRQYYDPSDRRFHAQPLACPACGPHYFLQTGKQVIEGDQNSISTAAQLLKAGKILAMKGLGGYHLACDAKNGGAVSALRHRKYRKEKPFALMVKDLETARSLTELSSAAEALLTSTARPIVLVTAKADLPGVSPDNSELGVMLPYAPWHFLLFASGAPEVLVMTSANRSSEPIAYQDEEAVRLLSEIADGFLIGERPIARRVEDSVARVGEFGPVVLRRSRGYAPSPVATLPIERPVLAVGADLKNTITLAVGGQAYVSQHIGDLEHYQAFRSFQETIRDLTRMYAVDWDDLLLIHDCHPQYASTTHALNLPAGNKRAVQHHRSHLASVLAERGAWEKQVIGVSFDGTGYGDDGAIWGGEIFVGSVIDGFDRVAHLRYAALPGGDAAAQYPVQAAAGFLAHLDDLPDMTSDPFGFPARYQDALRLVQKGVRSFPTTSMGRLFDTVAALLGFTRKMTFEGQAAIWLEHLARYVSAVTAYPFPFTGDGLDFRPLLRAVIQDKCEGRDPKEVARAFHCGVAQGLFDAVSTLSQSKGLDTVVLSGGVFQNELLLVDLKTLFETRPLQIWTNHVVPPNDGGVSLGQAALAAFGRFDGP
jgi:hydrogenase maturation protein HypF